MIVATLTIVLNAPWVRSLKEKRAMLKSLKDKIRHRFNVSVAEVATQDIHQTATIGIAAIAGNTAQADSTLDNIINFVETNSGAEIVSIERQTR